MKRNHAFSLIELLVVILIIGILLAVVVPNFVLVVERARRSAVMSNMHMIQTALEAYAIDHCGNYPNEDVSWEPGAEGGIAYWFPGGDPYGFNGEPTLGRIPVNPYFGRPYNPPSV